jgi:crotonobetainyl-CoA:carnitine CoA-transferase CaiB-like acyl-CoA transferase
VPFQAFEASDGWIIVGCAKEKFWQRLTEVIGKPEWASDPRFTTFADRQKNATTLLPMLEEIIRQRTVDEWLSVLYPASIPCGPINDVAQAMLEPHTIARNLIFETEHPRYGTLKNLASPVKVGNEAVVHRRAPQRNENFDEVMGGLLNYSPEKIASLSDAGAFGK